MKVTGLLRRRAIAVVLGFTLMAPVRAAETTHAAPTAGSAAPASSSTVLGTAGAWSAYLASDKTGRVCYLAGSPEKSESGGVSRRAPSGMVTHRPAENIANVVSFVEGYTLKPGSEVALDIGDTKFQLFTDGDGAWARTSDLDRTIVTALAGGHTAVVKGISAQAHTTVDVYSLVGFDKALALIDKACGVKREAPAAAPPATPVHHHAKPRKVVHKASKPAKPAKAPTPPTQTGTLTPPG
jgi:invasion protein IalB